MNFLHTVHARPWLAAACLAACSVASAVPAASAFSRPSLAEVSSPAVLRAYLRTKDEVRGSRYAQQGNRFCFVQQASRAGLQGDTTSMWMIWHEGGEILNSAGRAAKGEEAASLGRAEALAKSVDLATDVVESEEQIAGSTFLVDRAWVERIVRACHKTGRTVTVTAPRKGRR